MRKLSLKEKCILLGYGLHRNCKDVYGVNHPYCTTPDYMEYGGGINYFELESDVLNWIESVNQVRSACNNGISLLDLMRGEK